MTQIVTKKFYNIGQGILTEGEISIQLTSLKRTSLNLKAATFDIANIYTFY